MTKGEIRTMFSKSRKEMVENIHKYVIPHGAAFQESDDGYFFTLDLSPDAVRRYDARECPFDTYVQGWQTMTCIEECANNLHYGIVCQHYEDGSVRYYIIPRLIT